jgi:hypothetical protein
MFQSSGRCILVGSVRICGTGFGSAPWESSSGVRDACEQQRHLPAIQSTLAANHRSAARTAMPDLQLGIRVDAKRCERAKVMLARVSKSKLGRTSSQQSGCELSPPLRAQTSSLPNDVTGQKRRAGSMPRRQSRMNSLSDRSFHPSLAPAVRDLAALHEYLEGSHEANARQRNSGRGVARRTG